MTRAANVSGQSDRTPAAREVPDMSRQIGGARNGPTGPADRSGNLGILEAVCSSPEKGLTLCQLAHHLGAPSEAIGALVTELLQLGWLERVSDGKRLVPGPRLRDCATRLLAQRYWRSTDAHEGPDSVGQ